MKQYDATSRGLWPEVELVPPLSEGFSVYGGADTIERARQWALENRCCLIRGVPACAHGLYLMSCPDSGACSDLRWADHSNLWVPDDEEPRPFLLAHPYSRRVPPEAKQYARAHGLDLSSCRTAGCKFECDCWYSENTLAIRLDVRRNVLWPIERVIAALFATQPIEWPGD